MDKRWKEGGNGKRALDGLDSEPSVSPFDVEEGKICNDVAGFCSARKPAVFPPRVDEQAARHRKQRAFFLCVHMLLHLHQIAAQADISSFQPPAVKNKRNATKQQKQTTTLKLELASFSEHDFS